MVPGMAILAGLSAKINSARFQQESQGHDKDLGEMYKLAVMKMHIHRHKFETKQVVSPLSQGVSRKMLV